MIFNSISYLAYILLREYIVNPEREEIKNKDINLYYSYEVSQNIKKYFIFALIPLPVFNLLTIAFFINIRYI